MADARLAWLPATELAAMIKKKKVSPVEVVDAVLERIEKLNPRLNAFVTLTDTAARREAKAAERALGKRSARLGPLHGVPFSVKDLVNTKGVRTTFGTPFYRDNVPTEDAPMVERMKAAGAIMLGKTNTPTFGWIGATHNLVFGITRNPCAPAPTSAISTRCPRRARTI
jgi:Asp-tRNA(Asn)/Glu-tRNA(Gln) amidotransferase A subunit family amidase